MSEETSYFIDIAKRKSKCRGGKKCPEEELIVKGQIRIGVHVPAKSEKQFDMTKYYHPKCFNLPKKFGTGEDRITELEFLENHCEDKSGKILVPGKIEELAEDIKSKLKAQVDLSSPQARIRAALKEEEGVEPALKRLKTEGLTDIEESRVKAYAEYHTMTNGELQDILSWNLQPKSGNKDFLLIKCVDGELRARLQPCPLCGYRLKLAENGEDVSCEGHYDEVASCRVDCHYKTTAKEAPRWKPWYKEQPSEEEEEAMKLRVAEAKGEVSPSKEAASQDDMSKLRDAVKGLEFGNLSSKEAIQNATGQILDAVLNYGGEKVVDLPADRKEAIFGLGPIFMANKHKSAAEMVTAIVDEFGFAEDKKAKAVRKEEVLEDMCKVPANGQLVIIMKELADRTLKSGTDNCAHKGAAILKVVEAIKDLNFEITVNNVLDLGKTGNKSKVPGIGKGTSKTMKEFLETGEIEALNDLRVSQGEA